MTNLNGLSGQTNLENDQNSKYIDVQSSESIGISDSDKPGTELDEEFERSVRKRIFIEKVNWKFETSFHCSYRNIISLNRIAYENFASF